MVATRPGTCLAQPRIAIDATGLCLCGIADEPPRRVPAPGAASPAEAPRAAEVADPTEAAGRVPSRTSATSDWASKVMSRAILPVAADTLARAADRSMRRRRRV